jgi:hypothetical protein
MKPTARYLCGNCKHEIFYIFGTKEEMISGVVIGKCINSECKNKGKVVKINPQIIEVEECVKQEAGKV